MALYKNLEKMLLKSNLAYPCFCTHERKTESNSEAKKKKKQKDNDSP
jgi:glutamyl/glutaminyl-tRNA synthetase